MAKTYSKKKKKINKHQKKTALLILTGVIFISIVCSLMFGLKLYAYGKDVTVVYAANGGTVEVSTQVVEVCKSYQLKTPTHSGDREFLYWSTDGTEKGKVKSSGLWLLSTEDQIVLYAVWGEEKEWTGNY
ncbi:MAG: hypothetical protein IKA61_01630 [Clostridia bacterium]|nr:hypothetical protein [Clostridia bacterium]